MQHLKNAPDGKSISYHGEEAVETILEFIKASCCLLFTYVGLPQLPHLPTLHTSEFLAPPLHTIHRKMNPSPKARPDRRDSDSLRCVGLRPTHRDCTSVTCACEIIPTQIRVHYIVYCGMKQI
jgi:hypothetical protein